ARGPTAVRVELVRRGLGHAPRREARDGRPRGRRAARAVSILARRGAREGSRPPGLGYPEPDRRALGDLAGRNGPSDLLAAAGRRSTDDLRDLATGGVRGSRLGPGEAAGPGRTSESSAGGSPRGRVGFPERTRRLLEVRPLAHPEFRPRGRTRTGD